MSQVNNNFLNKNPLLQLLGYHKKWHGNHQIYRKPYKYSVNEFLHDHLMSTLGIDRGVFVEFGAIDGFKGSNVRHLIDKGWNTGIFIEPESVSYSSL